MRKMRMDDGCGRDERRGDDVDETMMDVERN